MFANATTREAVSKPENWFKKWALHSLSNHKARGMDIQVDINDLINLLRNMQSCFYCDHELQVMFNASIDMVDNKLPLTIENIVLCCRPCNSTKGTKSKEEYRQLLDSQPKLRSSLQESNENFLKSYYASFIPFEELKRIANVNRC